MTIALYIIGWLLSGFLAAWLGYKYADKQQHDTTYGTALWVTLCGVVTLAMVLYVLFKESNIMSKPLFKAKEPK